MSLLQEKEADRRRIEELQEENLTLCLAQQRSMEESQHLGWELEQLSRTTEKPQGTARCGESTRCSEPFSNSLMSSRYSS